MIIQIQKSIRIISQASEFFTIFNKYTLELRYPFSTSASSTIYGLAFFEAANGWYRFKDYNPFKLAQICWC